MKDPLTFDERLQAVSDALEQVEVPGSYCTMGACPSFPLPGLVVDGVGEILLPLTDTTAKALISACHLAPFGHGEQTHVDTQVRNTWELSTREFKIENAEFQAFIKDQIADACRSQLGISESVVFEAKLYKMLLYETGGKFERHQDSEKENGMFGTLVVVLPGRFEGGELVVHHPSAADQAKKIACERVESNADVCVFDAGAMDPRSIKYAAFYGDCPHEVRPVTKGYRLCLTYNLVKIVSPSTTVADPQFGSNHALYASMKEALEKFFYEDNVDQKKRQRIDKEGSSVAVGFDVTNPQTFRECKLVYLLTHKYTQANLSFDNLKHRDAAVAASLAHFCDSSDGAVGMYLCKMKYRLRWYGDEGTMYRGEGDSEGDDYDDEDDEDDGDSRRKDDRITRDLDLLRPMVAYRNGGSVVAPASGKSSSTTFSQGDLTSEVAPCGYFEKKSFRFDGMNNSEFTGNEGASSDRWYGSAAIVLAPLQVGAQWTLQAQDDPTALLKTWIEAFKSKPAHARAVASACQSCALKYSAASTRGLRMLEVVAATDNLDLIGAVMAAFDPCEFQPKFGEILSRFDAVEAVEKALNYHLGAVGYSAGFSTVNFVASILHGISDPSAITVALSMIETVAYVEASDEECLALNGEGDTTPEEFARLLQLVSLASSDHVKSLLEASTMRELVLIVAPAVRLLFDELKNDPNKCAVVVATANQVRDALEKKLPKLRNGPYEGITLWCSSDAGCACDGVRAFLKSLDKEATFDKRAFDNHIEENLECADSLDLFGVDQPSEEGTASTVVLKKTHESAVFKRAQQEIAAMDTLAAEFVRVAVVSGNQVVRSE